MQTHPHPLNGHHTARSFVLVALTGDIPRKIRGRDAQPLAIYRGLDRLTYRAIMRGRIHRKG